MSYTCPYCLMTSQDPNDEREQYCGNCHQYQRALIPDWAWKAADSVANDGLTGPVVMRIVGLPYHPTPFDEQWLVEYDPHRPGVDPDGKPMLAHIVTTPDRAKALRFDSWVTAHQVWCQTSGYIRPDGEPDRPLTAFAISLDAAGD